MDTFNLYILYNPQIDKYYVGSTNNITRRLKEHNSLTRSKVKYTRKQKGTWNLMYVEKFTKKEDARKREKQIKEWKSRKMIIELIEVS